MSRARTARGWAVAAVAALLGGAGVLAAVSLAADTTPASGAPEADCAKTETPVAELSRAELRDAIRCSLNAARDDRGLEPVAHSPKLQAAAQQHTVVMVRTDCLDHQCGDEPDLEARIRQAGYLRGAERWRYAENTGCAATVAAMTENWLDRRFHRKNILNARFDEIGFGVLHRAPETCGTDMATFAAVFGWRKR
jgi:uncharacterized protein YkwD